MPEMAHAGEDHRDAAFVGRGDDFGIAQGSARLDYGADAEFRRGVEAVAERKEGVRGHHAARDGETGIGRLHRRDPRRDDTARLTGADADRAPVLREYDRVRLHELADA